MNLSNVHHTEGNVQAAMIDGKNWGWNDLRIPLPAPLPTVNRKSESKVAACRKSFLLFVRILFRSIRRDELLLEQCKLVVLRCKVMDSTKSNDLVLSCQVALKKKVGENIWNQAMIYYASCRIRLLQSKKLSAGETAFPPTCQCSWWMLPLFLAMPPMQCIILQSIFHWSSFESKKRYCRLLPKHAKQFLFFVCVDVVNPSVANPFYHATDRASARKKSLDFSMRLASSTEMQGVSVQNSILATSKRDPSA